MTDTDLVAAIALHKKAHAPAIGGPAAQFEECEAEICERAREAADHD